MSRAFWLLFLLTGLLQAVPLRVVTFNIETNRNEDGWPNNALNAPGTLDYTSVLDILRRIDADVVVLQEVHTSDINEGTLDQLADDLLDDSGPAAEAFEVHVGSNSGNFDTSLRVALLSRYPLVGADSILSPAGAKEIARHAVAARIDVPGTDADPLVISPHLKSGTGTDDRFRRAIEMRRLVDYLNAYPLSVGGNFIVLGDFNPSAIDRGFDELPPGLPSTYDLGDDIGFPVSYSTNMVSYFTGTIPTLLDPRQLNGDDGTFEFGQTLDLLMVSPGIAGRPMASEIYNSALDVSNSDGLPKSGNPLGPSLSADASDHLAVFADLELDQEAFNLALAVSNPTITEGGPDGDAILTVTLAAPAPAPVDISFSSDDPSAQPVLTSVRIAAGGSSGSTPIRTSRNFMTEPARAVTFSAVAPGYQLAEAVATLLDSDSGYAFTQAGQTIVEDFNGFPGSDMPAPWTDDGGVWIGEDDGSSAQTGARSFGGSSERAAGFVSDGSEMILETHYTNQSPETLSILDISYDAEQWRSSLNGAGDSIEVELEIDGQVMVIPGLTFDASTSLPNGPVAGGSPVPLSVRVTGLSVPTGAPFTLRFRFVPDDNAAPLPDDVFINEFHYDNTSGDEGEFVEVVVGPGFTGDLSSLELFLYNGSNGKPYGVSHDLPGFTEGSPLASGHRVFSKLIAGIQNGDPDGFALVTNGVVKEFISYDGGFVATEGPAVGLSSVNIGVGQPSSNPVGERSIGRTGSGSQPSDFTWVRFDAGVAHSPGDVNSGQSILLPGVPSQGLGIDNVAVTFVEDTDGDGLANDEDADDDNDGLSDTEELAFGTNPQDATSRFRISLANQPTGPALNFPGATGVVYTIEWCDDLVSWDQSAIVEGTGAEVVFPLPASGMRLFARVRAGD